MSFKDYILDNHPDPDSVFGIDNYDFEQIVVLAENYAKDYHKEQSVRMETHRVTKIERKPCCDDMKIIKVGVSNGRKTSGGSKVLGNYHIIRKCKNCGKKR